MTLPGGFTIEPVRGTSDERRDEELVAFWTGHGALSGTAARARLPHVVCLLRDAQGDVAAVNSAVEERVPMLGNCRLWVYRSFAPTPGAREASEEMAAAAWEALAVGFDPDADAPIGICRFVTEAAVPENLRESVWPTSKLMFAGYTQNGEQLRVRYFDGAKVSRGATDAAERPPLTEIDWSLKRDYRIEHVDASESVSREDVADLWVREDALPRPRAERRTSQVCMVGTTPEGKLGGVSTAYLAANRQLRLELWHIRAFVAEGHRDSHLATQLLWHTRDHLAAGFASGEHTAPGAMIEVENEVVKRLFPEVLWQPTMFNYVGNNARGDHCRVHWFEGAQLPPPPAPAAG